MNVKITLHAVVILLLLVLYSSTAHTQNFMGKPVLRIQPGVQDIDENAYSVNAAGDTLTLTGNTWKAISSNYNVTANTVLQFEFRSLGQEPEINGVGFTSSLSATPANQRGWQVHGIDNWSEGITHANYSGTGWVTYTIPIGQTFTGNVGYMVFVGDDDGTQVNQIVEYRNPQLYENVTVQNFMGKPVLRVQPGVQDIDENAYSVNAAGDTLTLTGNTWKAISSNYNVTANTVLQFEFRSLGQEPEINGIGFTSSLSATPANQRGWQIHGVDNWSEGITHANYSGTGWVTYTIPIGQTFTGNVGYMVFVGDDDGTQVNQIVEYRNPQLYENQLIPEFMGETVLSVKPGQHDIDVDDYSVNAAGNTLTLTGNTWKAINYPYNVTPSTVLQFEFRSLGQEPEINGIGLSPSLNVPATNWGWQVHGIQDWAEGITHANYSGSDWVTYTVNIGHMVTGDINYMVFVGDDDGTRVNQNVEYRNPQLFEDTNTPFIDAAFPVCTNNYCIRLEGTNFGLDTSVVVTSGSDGSQLATYSGNHIYSKGEMSPGRDYLWFPIVDISQQNIYESNDGLCFKVKNGINISNEECFSRPLTPPQPPLLGKNVESYQLNQQDIEYTSYQVVGHNQHKLKLMGNSWKKIAYNYTVTPNTVLEFKFKSRNQEGEINGIGFLNDNSASIEADKFWQIFGTQSWGIQDYNDYAGSDVKVYQIPIGQQFTGQISHMLFAADDDPTGGRAGQHIIYINPTLKEVVPDPIVNLEVGVNYHAFGPDFTNDSFITQYNTPSVRSTVISQLQSMANKGVDRIFLRLFMIRHANSVVLDSWRLMFPPTKQELTNLQQFVSDVANTTGSGGQKLQLDVGLSWGGAADYTTGTVNTGLGNQSYSSSEFTSRVIDTYTSVMDELDSIYYPNTNTKVLKTIYFDQEVLYEPDSTNQNRINENWFVLTHYPGFVNYAQTKGFTPSVYFLPSGNSEENVFNDDYVDPRYPVVNGHRSMYWPYRSLKFMKDNGLHIPERIDFSLYTKSLDTNNFTPLLERMLNDADAVLSTLGIPSNYGAAETFYFADPLAREALVESIHVQSSNLRNYRLKRIWVWTTPYRGNGDYIDGTQVAWPVYIDEYNP